MNRRTLVPLGIALMAVVALGFGLRGLLHQPRHRSGGGYSHGRHRYPPTVTAARPPPPALPNLPAGDAPAVVAAPGKPARAPFDVALAVVAAQSDPARLATLGGSRGANPRLKRVVLYLALARDAGADPAGIIQAAQRQNGSAGTPRAPLVEKSLLRNLKIADGLGLLTPPNRALLRHGSAPVVTRGPYTGQRAEVDHIVPRALARELDHELANLELLPAQLNRRKSSRVGERQLDYAQRFRVAGLITPSSFARVQAAYRPAGTAPMELALP